jgi:ribonuclease HI
MNTNESGFQLKATVHTDGSCIGNPGPGGWACVIDTPNGVIELSGKDPETTNNRMEIMAAIAALEHLSKFGRFSVTVFTDSQYVKQAMSSWLARWKRTGWRKGSIKNQDLWKRLDQAASQHLVEWKWVRGHNGNPLNERCDQLATQQSGNFKQSASAPKTPPISTMLQSTRASQTVAQTSQLHTQHR